MRVKDEYRTNKLSLRPGGSLVRVIYKNGSDLEYDKIKFPKAYVSRLEGKEEIVRIFVDEELVWSAEKDKKFYWEK